MKMIKRIIALALVLGLTFALTACGSSNGGSLKSVEKGDVISLGDIDWVVLEVVDGKKALILSDKVLETRAFDASSNDWETSDIRQYLNGEFYDNTFSSSEKDKIIESDIANTGNNTKDKVFLLSSGDAASAKYFANNAERIALNINTGNTSWWWLRSPGFTSSHAALVWIDGYVYVDCYYVISDGGVRPALWLNL